LFDGFPPFLLLPPPGVRRAGLDRLGGRSQDPDKSDPDDQKEEMMKELGKAIALAVAEAAVIVFLKKAVGG
jgi:hypothetical protein